MAHNQREIDRLNRWRHFGDGPATYTAGSKQFGDDVIVALIEIERLRTVEKAAQAAYDYHMTGYNAADDFDANTQIELMDALGRALEPKPDVRALLPELAVIAQVMKERKPKPD
jgi:hypothetical protein